MAYDEKLAARVRKILSEQKKLNEKKMFGGLCFLLRGNMCCGVNKDDLMIRIGPDRYEKALAGKGARPMDFTGKPLKGFVFVGPEGHAVARDLRKWVSMGVDYALSLPAK